MQTISPREGSIDVAGGRLVYQVEGAGPPIILLHAGIADSRMWEGQLEELARGHTVVRYDMRGFGQSPSSTAEYSNEDDLLTVMRTLGLDRAILVGASQGGAVSIQFALDHPDMVAGLVLLAPGVSGHRWSGETSDWWPRIDLALESKGIPEAVELETQMWVDGPRRKPDEMDRTVRKRAIEMNTRVYELATEESLEREPEQPAIDRLAELQCPVLVIVGTGDVPDMLVIAARIERDAPHGRMVTLPDVAHLLSMEQPAEVNRLILDFLGEIGW